MYSTHAQPPIQRVLEAIGDAKPAGPKSWKARCPAHEDRSPSLSISEGDDGKVLLKCHAGCTTADVLNAINLEMRDLFPPKDRNRNGHTSTRKAIPPPKATPPPKEKESEKTSYRTLALAIQVFRKKLGPATRRHFYHNSAGEVVAMVARFDTANGKEFRPLHALHATPGPNGTVVPCRWCIGDPPGKWPIYAQPTVQKSTRPIIVVEGEKCADALASVGHVATTSAHGAQSPHKTDWTPLAGRDVVLMPDNDAAGEKYVSAVAKLLAQLTPPPTIKILRLEGIGEGDDIADVIAEQLEDGRGHVAVKQYVTDLLKTAKPLEIKQELPAENGPLASERPGESPLDDMAVPLEAPEDPHRLSRLYIEENCRHDGELTLRAWRGEWHRWDGTAYRVLPEDELRAKLTTLAKVEMDLANLADQETADPDKKPPTAKKVTVHMIADVAYALASLTMLPASNEAPAWIGGQSPFPASEILSCRNGLVHLPSLVAGKDHFTPPTPLFFSPNCLDFDFNIQAPEPVGWLAFLRQLWGDDRESIETLQEWIGYLLTPDTRQQKILMLVGPKRGGKGTIARVISGLIGVGNVAGPTLSSLGTNFGLWPLIGRTLAMIQDARLSGRTDVATIIERLLSISGEDTLSIDRKFLTPVTAKLYARFMLFTNELPKLNDSSGALPGRMILLRLTETFFGREDTTLTDRLLTERPGILLWAIAGWQRLRERGHFLQPQAAKGMLDDLGDLASPVGAFVRDCCIVGPQCQVGKASLYLRWKTWCQEQGRDHPGEQATFGRNLFAAIPSVHDAYPRIEGERTYIYTGIGLK